MRPNSVKLNWRDFTVIQKAKRLGFTLEQVGKAWRLTGHGVDVLAERPSALDDEDFKKSC